MRRDDDEFAALDLELVYIARKLKEAQRLESQLSEAGVDFLIEADTYRGGIIFQTERVGAFFYVRPEDVEQAHGVLRKHRYKPHQRMK